MSSRRECLLARFMGAWGDKASPESIDTVVKIVLADMGSFYKEFHDSMGPGVLVLQPQSKEAEMFYMTIEMLLDWREWNPDGPKDIQKMIEVAQRINPLESAAYLISEPTSYRFYVIDYEKQAENTIAA